MRALTCSHVEVHEHAAAQHPVANYKFKDWVKTETRGEAVTQAMGQKRHIRPERGPPLFISDRIYSVMDPIRSLRRRARLTQSALADAAGTSQPTVAAYEGGHKSPTLGTLRRMAEAVNLEASVTFHRPMTREERRSLMLHEAIAERLSEEPSEVIERARRTLDRMSAGPAGASQAIREWRVILDRPLEDLIPVLVDPSPWARELRHVTPFAGVLTAAERASVYRRFAEQERSP